MNIFKKLLGRDEFSKRGISTIGPNLDTVEFVPPEVRSPTLNEVELYKSTYPKGSGDFGLTNSTSEVVVRAADPNEADRIRRHETGHSYYRQEVSQAPEMAIHWEDQTTRDIAETLFRELVADYYAYGQVADGPTEDFIRQHIDTAAQEGLPRKDIENIASIAKATASRYLRKGNLR